MTEVEALFHASAAVLLLCLIFHHPAVAGKLGRRGFVTLVAGSLIPLLDFAVFYFRAEDRIAFLVQDHLFYGLFPAMLLIAASAALGRALTDGRTAWGLFACLSAGYLVHLLLALLTPEGVPLLAPFSARTAGLPLFSGGHPLLVGLLIFLLVCVEALPRLRGAVFIASAALLAVYVAAGAVQYGTIAYRARALANGDSTVSVEPANPWLTRWLVTVADDETYQVRRHGLDMGAFQAPEILPRWNDETLMVRLLADETVNRFYYRVFRHPVVRLEVSGNQFTLIMQELKDQFPLVPGRTFYYEADQDGRNRFYQVQRFD